MRGVFIILLLTASISCYAQSDFREGYLLTTSNDTIRGLLNKGLKENNSKFIQFKANEHAEVKEYSPNQLNAYQFLGDALYISRKVWNKDLYLGKVFMEALVLGPTSLYAHQGDYYITKTDSIEIVLKRNEKIANAAIREREIFNIEYSGVGALNYLLSDCSLLKRSLQSNRISEKILTKHIIEYNECKGEKYVDPKSDKAWSHIDFGISAGLYASKLRFSKNATNFSHLRNGRFSSYGASVMASAFFTSPRIDEKLSFRTDLMYTGFTYSTYILADSRFNKERHEVDMQLRTINISLSAQYILKKEAKYSPYINAGGTAYFHLAQSNQWIKEQEFGATILTYEDQAFHKGKGQLGLWGGFGVTTMFSEKLPGFIEMRLEGTNGVLPQSYASWHGLTSKVGNLYLFTGIKF